MIYLIAVYTQMDLITSNDSNCYKSRFVYVPNFNPTTNINYTTFRKYLMTVL